MEDKHEMCSNSADEYVVPKKGRLLQPPMSQRTVSFVIVRRGSNFVQQSDVVSFPVRWRTSGSMVGGTLLMSVSRISPTDSDSAWLLHTRVNLVLSFIILQINAFACKLDLASPPAGSESTGQNGLLVAYGKTVQQRPKNRGKKPLQDQEMKLRGHWSWTASLFAPVLLLNWLWEVFNSRPPVRFCSSHIIIQLIPEQRPLSQSLNPEIPDVCIQNASGRCFSESWCSFYRGKWKHQKQDQEE